MPGFFRKGSKNEGFCDTIWKKDAFGGNICWSGFWKRMTRCWCSIRRRPAFRAEKDEIIELAVLKAGQADGALCELETMDEFIRLSEGRRLPDKIVELTGITEQMLLDDGIEKRLAAERFAAMFGGKTLIVAYNAQFDLCFLYYFLAQFGMADVC